MQFTQFRQQAAVSAFEQHDLFAKHIAGVDGLVVLRFGGVFARRKQLLIADMESTIIEQECLDELAEYVGLREQISDI